MNKFIAQMGNDAVIRVSFFETEGRIDVQDGAPYDLSKAQDITIELVNQFRKRTKMAYKIEAPNVLLIELPVELQKIGNYFLEVLFQVPNEALADGLQAYRLRLDGVSIVEAGAVSGQVGATFGVVDPNTPTRAALLAQIETLTTERDNAKEAQAQAEEGKTTAETERDQAVRDKTAADEAKAQAEQERDTAKEAQATAERDKTQAEAERDQAVRDKTAADEAKAQAEQERDTAKEAQAQAEEGKAQAEQERDTAKEAQAQAEEGKAQAEQERDTAKEAQATAERDKTQAEAERDQARQDKTAADEAKAQAEQERDTAKEAQATAERDKTQAEAERDQAVRDKTAADEAKAQAEQERDTAKEAQAIAERDKTQAEAERDQALQDKGNVEADRDNTVKEFLRVINYLRKDGDISNPIVTKVENQAFFYTGSYGRYNIGDTVQLPAVTEVGVEAFRGCRVNRFDLPSVTIVRRDAFRHLDGWDVTVMMPKVEIVEEGAFLDLPAHSTVYVSEAYFDSLPSSNDELRKTFSIQRGAMDGTVAIVIEAVESKRQRLYEEFHAPQGW